MEIKTKFLEKVRFIKKSKVSLIFISVFCSFIVVAQAQAATFFMTPQSIEVKTGDTFTVDLRVNSADEGFNAAQATIQFPKDIVTIKSIDYSPSASVFNFWLDGPSFSNPGGSLTFMGGTTNGVVGASIGILKITFVANNTGDASIAISDAAITASDGSGTNILTGVGASSISIKAGTTPPTTPTTPTTATSTPTKPTTPTTPSTPTKPTVVAPSTPSAPLTEAPVAEKLPEPVQISREPVLAKEIPRVTSLALNVPFYPDQNQWYNLTSKFLAQWKLTPDISGVNSIINKNTIFTASDKSEGLFDSKFFPSLEDGIWYLHLALKNNKGWGDVSSYRLAIDTLPPLSFTVSALEGDVTDNPTPTLQFEAKDALSGLSHYLVRIDREEEINTATSTLKLSVQTPGKKNILVKAVDKADNIREGSFTLEILPIASPKINFINKEVFVDQGDLLLSGTALPGTTILAVLKNIYGSVVAKTDMAVDKNGNWESKFTGPFKKGQYYVEVITQDARGAISLPVKSEIVKINQKPFLIIGSLRITLVIFFVFIVLLLLLIIGSFYAYFVHWRAQIARRDLLAQRDVLNLFNSVQKDLVNMVALFTENGMTVHKNTEIKYLLKNSEKKLVKAEKYIIENIKEITD
jgi:hypothetical protein